MARETELKLSLNATDLPHLLGHPLLAARPRTRQLSNTYYDTPAMDLMRERIALRERRIGRRTWLTVKTAGQSAGGLSQRLEWEAPARAGALDVDRVVTDLALATRLMAVRPRLVPLFHTDFLRKTWVLTHGHSTIEVALDQGHIRTGGTGHAVPKQLPLLELELELMDGRASDLLDLAHTLSLGQAGQPGIWLHPDDRSKAERGLRLFTGERATPMPAGPLALDASLHPREAWRTTTLACLAQLQANAVGLLDQGAETALPDAEFVHQARVALRRLRTGLRLFAPWLPRRFVAHWSHHWKVLAQRLGEARNWDVLASEHLADILGQADQADADRWTSWVRDQREAANRRACQALREPGHTQALLAFMHGVLTLPPPRGEVQARLGDWAPKALTAPHRRLMRQTRQALHAGPDARHELRIAVKRMRYALGFLADVAPAALVRRSLPRLSRAQDQLGHLNDLDQARQLLAGCRVADPRPLLEAIDEQTRRGLRALPRLERQLLQVPAPD
jgi:inorganic triphosphatase YgiF